MDERSFLKLMTFLKKIPSVRKGIGAGCNQDGYWWVKFDIDINHQLAWDTIQALGHVLNYLSPEEKLPTSFYPISGPPYINGGPEKSLSWVIECHDPKFKPVTCEEWLEGRLPNPVEDVTQWEKA